MISTLKGLGLVAAAVVTVSAAQIVHAEYPERAVTIVSPYGAGGNADLAARALAAVAPKYLGRSVMVVNRTGAGGAAGSQHIIDSKADGYNLLLARVGSQAVGPAMNPSVPYSWDDFTIIGMLETNPYVCVVPGNSPIKDFDDFKAALKDESSTMLYGTTSVADASVAFPVTIFQNLGLSDDVATKIPFGGGGAQVAAVMGGQVHFACNGVSPFANAMESGDLRAIVVSTKERIPQAPDAPTAAEVDMPNLELVSGWSALYGPPNLPQDVMDTWVDTLTQVAKDEEWLRMVKNRGSQPAIWSPDETTAFVEGQYNIFRKMAKDLGMVE
ncbi:MAG: tripartite tricarboxylate transporter substrate binding protein [Aquisalimonadaceae bacterium]